MCDFNKIKNLNLRLSLKNQASPLPGTRRPYVQVLVLCAKTLKAPPGAWESKF